MSEIFMIECLEKPDFQKLSQALERDGLRIQGDSLKKGCNFYLDKISTRSIQVSAEEKIVEIKIFSLSSPQDCALALDIVEAAARTFKGSAQSSHRLIM